jgi:hypothetical protein
MGAKVELSNYTELECRGWMRVKVEAGYLNKTWLKFRADRFTSFLVRIG